MTHPVRLTETDLDEIERLSKSNAAETYRGPLLALVEVVRRLRGDRARGERQDEMNLGNRLRESKL